MWFEDKQRPKSLSVSLCCLKYRKCKRPLFSCVLRGILNRIYLLSFNRLLVLWSKSYTNSVQRIGDLAITWRERIQECFELVRKYRLRLGRGRFAAAASYHWMIRNADWREMREIPLLSQHSISSLQHLFWSFCVPQTFSHTSFLTHLFLTTATSIFFFALSSYSFISPSPPPLQSYFLIEELLFDVQETVN